MILHEQQVVEHFNVSFTDYNLKIKISKRLYSRVLILIFYLKSVNDKCDKKKLDIDLTV